MSSITIPFFGRIKMIRLILGCMFLAVAGLIFINSGSQAYYVPLSAHGLLLRGGFLGDDPSDCVEKDAPCQDVPHCSTTNDCLDKIGNRYCWDDRKNWVCVQCTVPNDGWPCETLTDRQCSGMAWVDSSTCWGKDSGFPVLNACDIQFSNGDDDCGTTDTISWCQY